MSYLKYEVISSNMMHDELGYHMNMIKSFIGLNIFEVIIRQQNDLFWVLGIDMFFFVILTEHIHVRLPTSQQICLKLLGVSNVVNPMP